jgi:hypothetical protein
MQNRYEEQAMQKLVETQTIEIDSKVTKGIKLPATMILYAVAADHFVITAKPLKDLEDNALAKTRVAVATVEDKIVIKLGTKIYSFYHLDESDYTVMVSEKDPATIVVTI